MEREQRRSPAIQLDYINSKHTLANFAGIVFSEKLKNESFKAKIPRGVRIENLIYDMGHEGRFVGFRTVDLTTPPPKKTIPTELGGTNFEVEMTLSDLLDQLANSYDTFLQGHRNQAALQPSIMALRNLSEEVGTTSVTLSLLDEFNEGRYTLDAINEIRGE